MGYTFFPHLELRKMDSSKATPIAMFTLKLGKPI